LFNGGERLHPRGKINRKGSAQVKNEVSPMSRCGTMGGGGTSSRPVLMTPVQKGENKRGGRDHEGDYILRQWGSKAFGKKKKCRGRHNESADPSRRTAEKRIQNFFNARREGGHLRGQESPGGKALQYRNLEGSVGNKSAVVKWNYSRRAGCPVREEKDCFSRGGKLVEWDHFRNSNSPQ